jgi:hypothetical protein
MGGPRDRPARRSWRDILVDHAPALAIGVPFFVSLALAVGLALSGSGAAQARAAGAEGITPSGLVEASHCSPLTQIGLAHGASPKE